MRIDILTVLPELLESPLNHSIVKRAREKGLVEINILNMRDFTKDKYKTVDDYAFGGGAGMVMMIEPVFKAIEKLRSVLGFALLFKIYSVKAQVILIPFNGNKRVRTSHKS